MSINKIYNIQEWQQVLIASTPSATSSIIYPRTDGNWYFMNSNGIEKILSMSYNLGSGLTSSTASGVFTNNLNFTKLKAPCQKKLVTLGQKLINVLCCPKKK